MALVPRRSADCFGLPARGGGGAVSGRSVKPYVGDSFCHAKMAMLPSWTFDIDGTLETVDINPEHGPVILTPGGQTSFMNLKNHSGLNQLNCVKMPIKLWPSLTSTEQEVLARMAAKGNLKMKQWKGKDYWWGGHLRELEAAQKAKLASHAKDAQAKALKDAEKSKARDERQQQDYEDRKAEAEAFLRMTPEQRIKKRCDDERRKVFIPWQSISLEAVSELHGTVSDGMFYGIPFPWTEVMLIKWGPLWLTNAFHAAGTLSKNNRVVRVSPDPTIKIDAGNNAGKFLFDVVYERDDPHLDTQLFAKVPFQMTAATKTDRLSSSVMKQPMDYHELNTYRLLEATLPMIIPRLYYCDISNETSNYILITARIPFVGFDKSRGSSIKPESYEIEGPYDKCKDFQLRGSDREYYTLLMEKSGTLGGSHWKGTLASDQLLKCSFGQPQASPSNRDAWGMNEYGSSGEDPDVVARKVDTAIEFFSEIAKRLYPEYVTTTAYKAKFKRVMMIMAAYIREIEYWKHSDPDYIAIGHMNMNIDNAYFWRDENGKLDCGVLDWGGMGSNCMGHKIWWQLNCAEFQNIQANLTHYIETGAASYERSGGPKMDRDLLYKMAILTSLPNTYMMVGAVPNALKQCPAKEFATIRDRHDPRIAENVDGKSTLRTTLHVLLNGVRIIEEMCADEVLEQWIQDVYVGEWGFSAKSDAMMGI